MRYIYNLLQQFFAFLLNTTDKYVGNFGISIIVVTILIKILLLPLTLKQDKSMKEMKKLQPELEKIKQKYANDKQMLNIKTMELYREHKVNPLGGCLPILIQLPILFALFGVLRNGIIPKDSSFLWMKLVEPDPFYILPVLNGAVSFLQQKLMGTSDNPQMKNMMFVFPILMIVISYIPGSVPNRPKNFLRGATFSTISTVSLSVSSTPKIFNALLRAFSLSIALISIVFSILSSFFHYKVLLNNS